MASIQISAVSFTQGCVKFFQSEQYIKKGREDDTQARNHAQSVCVAFTYTDVDSKQGDHKS